MPEEHSSVGAYENDGDYDAGSDSVSIVSFWTDDDPEEYLLPTVECGPECPLRKPYIPIADPPLPVAHASLPLTQEEACAQLYSPINPWQTRLLHLDASAFDTELSASLNVVDIIHLSGAVLHEKQQRVQFAALSYTWGAAVFPRSIKINNIAYPITENLFAFIQRYRSTQEPCYLWVDALCINQFDLGEKATQVSQMLAIFERAHTVIVWLGEEGPNTRLAMEYLHWAKEEGLDTPLTVRERLGASGGDRLARVAEPERKGHGMQCLRIVTHLLSGIEDICSRNWVRRIWVKQEVWGAKRLIVRCGTSQLTWSEYVYGLDVDISPTAVLIEENPYLGSDLWSYHHRPNIPLGELTCLRNLRTRLAPSQVAEGMGSDELNVHEILKLLNESTDCQTTNSHDRIYALMGMAGVSNPGDQAEQNGSELSIEVDYNVSLEFLYRRLAMSIMLYAGPYSILATDGVFGARQGFDFPSWTPDFRQPTRCTLPEAYRLRSVTTHSKYYRVEDEVRIRRFRDLNADIMSPALYLEGIRIAKITEPVVLPPEWDVFPIIVTQLGGGRHTPIEHYPFLKAMAAEPIGLIQNQIVKGRGYLFPAIASYVNEYAAFAVSTTVCSGDIVALVETVSVPVVLRPIEHKEGCFRFVSCGWLFRKASKLTGVGVLNRPPWDSTLQMELTEVTPRHQEINEVFCIE